MLSSSDAGAPAAFFAAHFAQSIGSRPLTTGFGTCAPHSLQRIATSALYPLSPWPALSPRASGERAKVETQPGRCDRTSSITSASSMM
jgi:hypothetical protein